METVFYHGIKEYYSPNEAILRMLEIIDSGGIKSRRLQGKTSPFGFNGDDYISICERKSNGEYLKYSNNAFFKFIQFGFCFIISNDVSAIPIKYLDCSIFPSFGEASEYMRCYPNIRFSDMFDEWQVKDEIPLTHIVGIGLSGHKILNYIKYGQEQEAFKNNLSKLDTIAKSLNWYIVNTDTLYMKDNYIEYLSIKDEKKKIL